MRAAEPRRRYERASSFVGTFRARIWADAVTPGMLDPRVIDQAVWWVDFFGRAHRIHDERSFATDYLLNVLMFIREHAQAFVADVDNARIVLEVMHGSALLHALERELDRRLGE
ncbi:hypothetical protein [Agromyces sp. NPDC056965]|uniref:hypothetical protein n=1 Tax=Agromyces sp. NPDC056965 TaxID=3345983 RepID=UPI00362D7C46